MTSKAIKDGQVIQKQIAEIQPHPLFSIYKEEVKNNIKKPFEKDLLGQSQIETKEFEKFINEGDILVLEELRNTSDQLLIDY